MDAAAEQDVKVAFGDVRAGVADLVRAPAALDGALDLARRAGVDADAVWRAGLTEVAKDLQDLGKRIRLEREPDTEREARSGEGLLKASRVLGEAGPVVDEEWRPVLASQRLGVLAGDLEANVDDPQAGGGPQGPAVMTIDAA